MSELLNPSDVVKFAGLLAPGLIIASIRTRAITGSIPDLKDRIVAYVLITTAYLACVTPFFHVKHGIVLPVWSISVIQNFIIPVIIGTLLAYIHQWQWSYRIAEYCGLHLAHHLPTSWDYIFESLNSETLILVTLSDGSQVAGKMTKESFASSSRDERDLFIQEVWEIPEEGDWQPLTPPRGILLCGGDIRFVEVF